MASPKQVTFAREYLVDLNGAAAARRAGYKGTDHSMEVLAYRLLRSPGVAAMVNRGMAQRSERTQITADRVLVELARIAFHDPIDLFDAKGNPKPIADIPEHVRRAIIGCEVVQLYEGAGQTKKHDGMVRKIKLADKLRALELLARHLGLIKERVEVEVTDRAAALARALTRVNATTPTPN